MTKTTTTRLTTVRVCNGNFEVWFDGIRTDWMIINGSLGMSGNGRNMYGIIKGDFIRWIGPLNSCKKTLAFSLSKDGK